MALEPVGFLLLLGLRLVGHPDVRFLGRLLRFKALDLFHRLAGQLGQQSASRQFDGKISGFISGQRAIVNAKIVDLPLEGPADLLIAHGKGRPCTETTAETAAQVVFHRFGWKRLAIKIKTHSRRSAGAVVVQQEVTASFEPDAFLRLDLNGIAGPAAGHPDDQGEPGSLGAVKGWVVDGDLVPTPVRRWVPFLDQLQTLSAVGLRPKRQGEGPGLGTRGSGLGARGSGFKVRELRRRSGGLFREPGLEIRNWGGRAWTVEITDGEINLRLSAEIGGLADGPVNVPHIAARGFGIETVTGGIRQVSLERVVRRQPRVGSRESGLGSRGRNGIRGSRLDVCGSGFGVRGSRRRSRVGFAFFCESRNPNP